MSASPRANASARTSRTSHGALPDSAVHSTGVNPAFHAEAEDLSATSHPQTHATARASLSSHAKLSNSVVHGTNANPAFEAPTAGEAHARPSNPTASALFKVVVTSEVIDNKESILRDCLSFQGSIVSWLNNATGLLLGAALLGYNGDTKFALTMACVSLVLVGAALFLYYYHLAELERNKPTFSRVTVTTMLVVVVVVVVLFAIVTYLNYA